MLAEGVTSSLYEKNIWGNSTVQMTMAKEEFQMVQPEQEQEQEKVLGIGFLDPDPVTNVSYGMKATYAEESTEDHPVIKVTVTRNGEKEPHYINIKEINPAAATELEMFALCCYADDTGQGTGHTFGTWRSLCLYRQNALSVHSFQSSRAMDAYDSLRQNWVTMVENIRSLYVKAGLYQQSFMGNRLLQLFKKV